MKHYYVDYYRDFANTYHLVWADAGSPEDIATAKHYTRITRAEAVRLAKAETERNHYDYGNSGYADNIIFPVKYREVALRHPDFFVIENRIASPCFDTEEYFKRYYPVDADGIFHLARGKK